MFDFKDDEDGFDRIRKGISKENLMKGGAFIIGSMKDKNIDAKDVWDKLHEMGLSDVECELCSSAVKKFIKHQNGKHDECGSQCVDGTLDMSDRADAIKLIKDFEFGCIKCGTDRIDGRNASTKQIEDWEFKCPECKYPVHSSLMNAIERHFRGNLPDDEVEMFKMGFEWAKIK